MRRFLFALPLFAGALAFAQTPRPFTLHHTYSLDQPPVDSLTLRSCPVGMTAEQQATAATQWVVSLEDSRNPSRVPPGKMGVHVALKTATDAKLRTARVEVAYLVPPTGLLWVGGNETTETRTFDLSTGEDPTQELERSLLIGSGVSIEQVRLLSLTYGDGTVWQPSGNRGCSVRVSHLLRVAAAHPSATH